MTDQVSPSPAGGAGEPGKDAVPGVPERYRPPAAVEPAHRHVPAAVPVRPPGTKRTSGQIRADIEIQRLQLGASVEALRERVTELTDWRGQVRKHRRGISVGAAVTGFAIGGVIAALRRR